MQTIEPSIRSNILLIQADGSQDLGLGADIAPTTQLALEQIATGKHSVYFVDCAMTDLEKINLALREARALNRSFEIVVRANPNDSDSLKSLLPNLRVHSVIENNSDPKAALLPALEAVQLRAQTIELTKLIREQNNKLTRLSQSLEERVAKRQAYLQKAHQTLLDANRKGETLQKAIIAVHKSNSISEIETGLGEVLKNTFQIAWVRVQLFDARLSLEQIPKSRHVFKIFTVDLDMNDEKLGTLNFARRGEEFSKSEKNFLTNLANSVSLALARLKILNDTEEINQQWEATFNSISSPLALIRSDFEVLRANGGFYQSKSKINKCYAILFGRTSPCENCKLGGRFKIDFSQEKGKVTIYDVSSQRIGEEESFVNIYRDISAHLQIETRVMESAKTAELGTIGSSIAHEINNPLSGIITFIELIKMDLKGDEPFYQDIIALADAANRCKEIVQSLLIFSRAPSEQNDPIDINNVTKKAVQIIELQSRSSEIVIETKFHEGKIEVVGNFGSISQALVTYLQLAIEAARSKKLAPIRISIVVKVEGARSEIFIFSPKVAAHLSGPQILRRTIAERIISEMGGTVEYFAEHEGQVLTKIAFPVNSFTSEV